jgi:hypothetical protein
MERDQGMLREDVIKAVIIGLHKSTDLSGKDLQRVVVAFVNYAYNSPAPPNEVAAHYVAGCVNQSRIREEVEIMPYCSACGVANIADAKFCKMCAARIGVPIIMAPAVPVPASVPVVTQAMAATARRPMLSPGLAGLMSAIWPGAGQLYSGRAVGLVQMIFVPLAYAALLFAAFFSLAIGEFLIAGLLVLATLWIWMKVIEDAAKGAQRINAVRANARAAVRAARLRWLCVAVVIELEERRAQDQGLEKTPRCFTRFTDPL